MHKRVFISHIVPKNDITKLDVSMAANYFSYNLINGNCFDKVFSLVPTNINIKIEDATSSIIYMQSRFISNRGLFKLLNVILDNFKLYKKISKNSNVWFYNLTHQNIFIYLLLKFFKSNVKVFVILLDFTPHSSRFSLQSFIFKQLNKADGLISLTNNKELSLQNKIILPGLVPNDEKIKTQKLINNVFLLSGILSKNRCPELILKVFSKHPEYEILITGKIEDEKLVEKYINKFGNIKYLGFLKYDEYLKILDDVTYSINSRDPSYQENNFNFPSKTIEHLKHNKIIISTMEYSELDGIDYFYVKPTIENFIIFFKKLKSMDANLLLEKYANQSDKVFDIFGVSIWKNGFEKLENNI